MSFCLFVGTVQVIKIFGWKFSSRYVNVELHSREIIKDQLSASDLTFQIMCQMSRSNELCLTDTNHRL